MNALTELGSDRAKIQTTSPSLPLEMLQCPGKVEYHEASSVIQARRVRPQYNDPGDGEKNGVNEY